MKTGGKNKLSHDSSRVYGRDYKSPVYDSVSWTVRDAEVTDSGGRVISSRKGLDTPSEWSDLAVKIVGTKYLFTGDNPSAPVEKSVKQLIHRVADSLTQEGIKYGHVKQKDAAKFYDEVASLVLNQTM